MILTASCCRCLVSVSQSSPFNLLLRLFKYDDVLGELDEVRSLSHKIFLMISRTYMVISDIHRRSMHTVLYVSLCVTPASWCSVLSCWAAIPSPVR